MSNDGEVLVQSNGWSIVARTEQWGTERLRLARAPCCGAHDSEINRFWLRNDDASWSCSTCGFEGTALALVRTTESGRSKRAASKVKDLARAPVNTRPIPREIVDRGIELLRSNKFGSALTPREMLTKRGVSLEVARRFRIGIVIRGRCESPAAHWMTLGYLSECSICESQTTDWLWCYSIPIYQDGILLDIIYQSCPGERPRIEHEAGRASYLWNTDAMRGQSIACMFASPIDAVAAAGFGVKNVLAMPAAGPRVDAHNMPRLADLERIVIAVSRDEDAEPLANQLGHWRCSRADLPDDVCNLLEDGKTPDDIKARLRAATEMETDRVLGLEHFRDKLRHTIELGDAARGRGSGWSNIDDMLGGVRDRELTIVTGESGHGKSTWTLSWLLHQSVSVPCLLGSFENDVEQSVRILTTQFAGQSFPSMSVETYEQQFDQMVRCCNIKVIDHHGAIPLGELDDIVAYSVRRFGVKFLVIDNAQFAMPDEELDTVKQWSRTSNRWCRQWQIHVVLIVHPKRRPLDRDGKRPPPEISDLRGGSVWEQDAMNICRVQSMRDAERPSALVSWLKARHELARTGDCLFGFDNDSLRYSVIR